MTTIQALEKLKKELPEVGHENIQERMRIYEKLAIGNSKLKLEEGEELFQYLRNKQEREMFQRKRTIHWMLEGYTVARAESQAKLDSEKLINQEIENEAQYKYLRSYSSGISDLLSAIMQNNSIIKLELK